MISVPLHIMRITIFLFLPYLMMALGYGTKRKIADFGKKAEISYGIYLFGWPAQQCIVKYFGVSMSAIHNFILASVIAILCGFITYLICKTNFHPYMTCRGSYYFRISGVEISYS